MHQKKLLLKSHYKHVIKHRKNCNVQTYLMLFVCFFVLFFSMHKSVRPADTDKVANLAQHLKSLGTAALHKVTSSVVQTCWDFSTSKLSKCQQRLEGISARRNNSLMVPGPGIPFSEVAKSFLKSSTSSKSTYLETRISMVKTCSPTKLSLPLHLMTQLTLSNWYGVFY